MFACHGSKPNQKTVRTCILKHFSNPKTTHVAARQQKSLYIWPNLEDSYSSWRDSTRIILERNHCDDFKEVSHAKTVFWFIRESNLTQITQIVLFKSVQRSLCDRSLFDEAPVSWLNRLNIIQWTMFEKLETIDIILNVFRLEVDRSPILSAKFKLLFNQNAHRTSVERSRDN